ncbi:MAG: Gfo/Idh/MocA family oxidoreductase [Verrucomicrobiota bacterium]|nr:Gfo/Idh/MocA family oxidoreductase [Verrucomicrobiota bacterium]
MLRVALVGCGLWGKNILRVLVSAGATVTVVDPDNSRRNDAVAAGATNAFASPDSVRTVDGFIVATPATTHADVIAEVFKFGLPVFVEKPFTTDLSSAERLAAAGTGKLFVMDIWRYHPGISALADISRSQELGPVELLRSTRTNWTSPRRDTDAIWTLLPHDLAITLEILGSIPAPQFAIAEKRGGAVVGATLSLGKSPAVVIEVSTRYPDKRREVRLHCRDGVAVFNAGLQSSLEIFREKDGAEPISERRAFDDEEPLRLEVQAFLNYLKGGPEPKSSAKDGVAVVQAITTIRQLAGL